MSDFVVSQVDSLRESKHWRDQTHVRPAGYALLLGIAYYFATKLGFALTFHPHPVSTLWPANAILLAAFLLAPRRLWWALLLGAFQAHLAVQLQGGVPILMVLCWFISNASEALIGAFCIRRFVDGSLRFETFRSVTIFTAFAGFLAPFTTSFLDAGFVALIGWGEDSYWLVWRMRLLANVLGTLTLAPVIVMVGTGGLARLVRAALRHYVEIGLFAAGLLTFDTITFQRQSVSVGNVTLLVYAPIPFLLWAAVRGGPVGVSASLLVTALLAIWGTVHGRGPFTTLSVTENVFSLQMFLIVMIVPLMFLAALMEERRRTAVSLRESEGRHRAFFELTAVGAAEANAVDGRLLRVNRAYCLITGYSRAELLRMTFIDITHPEDRERSLEKFRRLMRGELTEYRNEKRYLRKDGRVAWALVDVSVLRDRKGQPLHTVAIVQDITKRKRAESWLRSQYGMSRILSESTSIAEAGPRVIQSICELLGWTLGEIWRVDPEAGLLTCVEIWHQPSSELAEFASASRGSTVPPGVGLPGRVWKNGQPGWIADILGDSSFPCASLAAKAGLRSALGFPIVFGGEVLGVMVLISPEARRPDEDLLRMMASIGSQIGQFIERKRAEESLRRSERDLRDFFQNATVGLTWVGSDGIILRANQAELDMLGCAHEEYVGHPIAEFHANPEVAVDILRRLAAGETLSEYEAQLCRKDGTIRHVLISANVLWEEGRFVHTRCFTRDITERKQAEEELHRLSGRLLDLQDEERRRIARELHDGTAQNLFAISVDLARLQEPGLLRTSEGKDTLVECQALCEQSLQEIRTLSYLLHPPLLDQVGLVSTLQWYVDGFAKRSGIDVALVVMGEMGRLPRQVEMDLFRVVQEGLANVHRHSGSGTGTVRLEKQGAQLVLQIEDQGCGMREALATPPEEVGSLGVGILGMRQRLRQHGGHLEITSSGQGTTVRVTVPLFEERRSRARTGHAGA